VEDLNACETIGELEFKIRNFLNDLEEAEQLLNPMVQDKKNMVLESLKSYEKQIHGMNEKLPSVNFCDEE